MGKNEIIAALQNAHIAIEANDPFYRGANLLAFPIPEPVPLAGRVQAGNETDTYGCAYGDGGMVAHEEGRHRVWAMLSPWSEVKILLAMTPDIEETEYLLVRLRRNQWQPM